MGVEKTVIRDSKSDSGIVGLTRKAPALLRWTMTRHIMGDYAATMKQRGGISIDDHSSHEESHPGTKKRDEEHHHMMSSHLDNHMTNPFELENYPDKLINISTGVHATDEVQKYLLSAKTVGTHHMEKFVQESLSLDCSKSFYSPISRLKIKTFADMNKNTRVCGPSGRMLNVSVKPELIFRRALSLAKCREDVTLDTILSHPVGCVPTSMFHEDGTMRKNTKSDLAHKLEENINRITVLPPSNKATTVYIRDGMVILQMMQVNRSDTFEDVASNFTSHLLQGFNRADTLVEVFDRYDHPDSVKYCERVRREATNSSARQYEVTGGRTIPPWEKFMKVSANKQAFVHFLTSHIENHTEEALSANCERAIFIAGGYKNGEDTKVLSAMGVQLVPDLCSSQEEADTRMLLHANSINQSFERAGVSGSVIIKSCDTDVLVLAIYYFPQFEHISKMWIETGTVTKSTDLHRFIPVHDIVNAISPSFTRILPAVHALTGCDSTSAFFHIGKKSVYRCIQKSPNTYTDLASMGTDCGSKAVGAARQLIADLYDPKGKGTATHMSMNTLRVKMALEKDLDLARMPPCEPSFLQQTLRSSWQVQLWMASHIPRPELGSPESYGWKREDDRLVPVYFTGPMASELLKDLMCSCSTKKKCSSPTSCVCRQQHLPCIELCTCNGDDGCHNMLTHRHDEDVSSDHGFEV